MNTSNFEKFPEVAIDGFNGYAGWKEIVDELAKKVSADNKKVVVVECYPGVDIQPFLQNLQNEGYHFIDASTALKAEKDIAGMVYPFVTDDPVFGYLSPLSLADFFEQEKLEALAVQVASIASGTVWIVGTGASLVPVENDLLVYADMPRWEIQLRFRRGVLGNLGADNNEDEFSYKYKRAFFVDWRVCDRLKMELFESMDYVLDTTYPDKPKMITGDALLQGLQQVVQRPFRVVPFFDPGPWGGQWLKEVCDLDRSEVNFAWGFDCVPEENSLLLRFADVVFETPAINLVFLQPKKLLGQKVYEAFGAEFPIRFDFLDTMEGGNLSLQVHPLKEYIKEKFGMPYTQDESYYFLEAQEDSYVYLGLKENVVPEKMIGALEAAQEGDSGFDADAYVEKWPIKKHDHVLIPAGTVHCSGANSVVLEISATPYIFTFKLWDWGRMGLNGKPRPISLEHGKASIQWDRTTQWTKENILNKVEKVAEGEGWVEEKTGLDDTSFIETRRHWSTGKVTHHTNGVVNILNLVEGREAIVESPSGAFAPFVIHYAETFIVPAAVGDYTVRPHGESEGSRIGTIKAYVRQEKLLTSQTN
ncbi:class I mannose-6-phosphate isomerase [Flavisolibacter sp. BT320]|nr:class I mannose-6-phosphate isomerase [Flavisolibacter longurius]